MLPSSSTCAHARRIKRKRKKETKKQKRKHRARFGGNRKKNKRKKKQKKKVIFFIIAIDDFVLVKKIEPKWQKNFFNFSFTMHHRNDVCRMIGLQKKSICFSANSCLKKKRKRRFRFFGRKRKKNKMAEKFGGHIEFANNWILRSF